MNWQDEVLDFWFGLAPDSWWKPDPALDETIRERFEQLWEEQRQTLPEAFLGSPRDAHQAATLSSDRNR